MTALLLVCYYRQPCLSTHGYAGQVKLSRNPDRGLCGVLRLPQSFAITPNRALTERYSNSSWTWVGGGGHLPPHLKCISRCAPSLSPTTPPLHHLLYFASGCFGEVRSVFAPEHRTSCLESEDELIAGPHPLDVRVPALVVLSYAHLVRQWVHTQVQAPNGSKINRRCQWGSNTIAGPNGFKVNRGPSDEGSWLHVLAPTGCATARLPWCMPNLIRRRHDEGEGPGPVGSESLKVRRTTRAIFCMNALGRLGRKLTL